ncbi:hypothetical protein PN488_02845 [Nodularia spumigena CS-591/12]|uniref:hypothetical protein n=1 Tax=Nodularia spumigena TaxID=70799 RepID=UPI00232E33DE|nr:hypothetical protein [Nodularia spumigena]MDB9303325.1 hypothetical protein [Nodularia spumigena CS-591/12]
MPEHLKFWYLASFIILLSFWVRLISGKYPKNLRLFYVFIAYIIVYFAIATLLDTQEQGLYITRLILFVASLSTLPLLLTFPQSSKNAEVLNKCFDRLLIITCAYAWYQFLGGLLGLPTGIEIFRGRNYGTFKQITSFFDEPAFFGQFLLATLYVNLCVKKERNLFLIILIISTSLLTFSVFSILSSLILSFLVFAQEVNFVQSTIRNFKIKKRLVALFILVFMLPISLNIISQVYEINPLEIIYTRVEDELFNSVDELDISDNTSTISGSGQVRIIGEINTAFLVLREKPLFGYGLNYSQSDIHRPLSLNVITEILVRWGIVGLLLLVSFIFIEKNKYRSEDWKIFVVFMMLFCFGDGGIAKPIFWALLTIIFFLERENSSSIEKS